ncbi:hypothetical protein [Oerskovia flava]|uniref:hypothetical protein n=1 Tax=Oerskovia flava TaxID=2986422 RepID=UPI00223FDEAE|nr:hypothetical protein [Oerskovia sp. JB1-3-2]
MKARSPRRAPRTLGGIAAGAVVALTLAACAQPVPTPDPEASPATPPPVLTEAQDLAVLEEVGSVLEASVAENDPDLLAPRVTGPALDIRTSQLKVAADRDEEALVTALPTEVQQLVVPTTQTWPRTSYAVSVQPEDLQSPRLMVFEQAGARDPYKLWGWVRLFPSTTLPSFADPSIGSDAVGPDDESLALSPADAVAQYVDVLNLGEDSEYDEDFGADPFRTFLEEYAEVQNDALEPADGSMTMTFEAVSDEPVRAVRTADGGALVVARLTSREARTAEEDAEISPATETERSLFGDRDPTNELNVRYIDVVALYVPPADSDELMQAVGSEHVATAVSTG